ncbi:MAG: hypothetical protein BAJALOKI3v1_660030 [Promethearchaeota archaeon]|nr:MAG: hypothetical protein BAJALOKI3v1_660030 [Candidatus Lokiarchaeota archaeon]
MPYSKKKKILFDLAHNEMLNFSEAEYSEFLSLLDTLNQDLVKNESSDITKKVLREIDVLVIGNPINDFFSTKEIVNIINFVKHGGSLLLISEYGGDALQKTNINDISGKYFNIFFEKNILKERDPSDNNSSNIIKITSFSDHEITTQLREVVIGGSCSLLIKGNATILLSLNDNGWAEKYNSSINDWDREVKKTTYTVSACTIFGKGKVVALGDIDIFSKDPNFGINKLENRKFITNLFNWLIKPNEESDTIDWALEKISSLEDEILKNNKKINNLIETITFLEKRISKLEENK